MNSRIVICSSVLFLATFSTHSACPQTPPPSKSPSALTTFGNLPLSFEENQGQADPSVQFLVHGTGYSLALKPGEAIFAPHRSNPEAPSPSLVRITLSGANKLSRISPEDPQITRTNYFLGNDPDRWRTNIPNYAKVRYYSVYPGIDLVYYGNQGQLEHDFVVAPGADPRAIRLHLRVDNLQKHGLHLDAATGDLLLDLGTGLNPARLRLLKPVTYQVIHGRRLSVPSNYRLLAGNQISFAVGRYDSSQPLIIDPILTFSTYYGGSGSKTGGDAANGIAVDMYGNVFLVGTANSEDFPITTGSYQANNYAALTGHGSTVFVSEFGGSGTFVRYSTYLGGSGGDFGYGIAVDKAGKAYITGATHSVDFPVTCTAVQPSNKSSTPGATTAFVAKLNKAGDALLYSTYLGGKGNQSTPAYGDVAQAIAVTPSGNAYVTGYTWSGDFPVTAQAFQPAFAGTALASNAFLTELNPAGTSFVFSTYLGGNGSSGAGDAANAIVLDKAGDIFLTGSTTSSNFPVTAAALQASLKGSSNAFLTELDPAGKTELYSTYLGGSGNDSAKALALDSSGNVYLAGNTSSSDFPLTSGVLEDASIATNPFFTEWGLSSFVSKLSLGNATTASTLEYSTYLEGAGSSVSGLAVDSKGSAYVAGTAYTAGAGFLGGFQSTSDALPVPKGPSSAFIVKLDPQATVLNFATLLGGSSTDAANALALDASGNAFIAGLTNSSFQKNKKTT